MNIVKEVADLFEGYEFLPADGAYLEGETVAAELLPVPIGGGKVANLEFNLIPPGEYPVMTLRLVQAGKDERQIVREAQTSPAGQAALRFVLMDVPCVIEVEKLEEVEKRKPTFEICKEAKEEWRLQIESMASICRSRLHGDLHSANILLEAAKPRESILTPWRVFLRSGNNIYLPTCLPSKPGRLRLGFNRLGAGRFIVEVKPIQKAEPDQQSLAAQGKIGAFEGKGIAAGEHAFAAHGQVAETEPIEPLTIHLSDWSIKAVLEGSRRGGSFLIFFTEDEKTFRTNLRYQLGIETGPIVWEETATSGLWRSDHPLTIAAERAMYLAPELKISEAANA